MIGLIGLSMRSVQRANLPTRALAVAVLAAGLVTGCNKSSAPAGNQAAPAPTQTSSGGISQTTPGAAPGTVQGPAGSAGNGQGATGTTATGPGAVGTTGSSREREQAARPMAPAGVEPGSRVAAAPVERTVPAGTSIPVRVTETLSASRNQVGDRFTGVVAEDVISHGETVFRRGTPVEGTVVASKGRGKFKGAGDLAIQLTSIRGERVSTSEYEVASKGKGKRTAEFIGGGAGVGALIGGLAGGGKGAALGALAGGGAGTAAGAYTGNKDVVIPSESLVRFKLTESIRIR